ncbi:MAG TPA: Holliday junction resolvase RuvX [Erysipelotrichaceae bacterium]|nr:Holliday junction resolvase RuvX [Erysipelotrichaceae bacterium]
MTRYLGLDLGSVTCGVSESDTGFIARTVVTLRFKPDDYDSAMDQVLELVNKEKPDIIVLGYPKLLNDDVGERGHICEEFGAVLEQESGIKVVLWDERYTTKEAEAILLEADMSRKKRKKKIDQLAAVQILQSYLDSQVSSGF